MTGAVYPWIVRATAMVNHFYFYCVDAEFGPFFLKFCSYFPYNARLCVNCNERAKRVAAAVGIGFTPLDNAFAGVDDPADVPRLQRICDGVTPAAVDRLLRKWLKILPHPFTPADRAGAGVRPADHPQDKHATPGVFRIRVLTSGVTLGIGKRLCHLPDLAQIGYQANRRLLDVERLTTDPTIGECAFHALADPIVVGTQRASALPFDSVRTQALLAALVVFRLLPHGFRNADLRAHLAPLLGLTPADMTQGRMSYDLRRLRLHGLIERLPGTHRYTVTDHGLKIAIFLTRTHNRLIRAGLTELLDDHSPPTPLRRRFDQLDDAIHTYALRQNLIT